MIPVAKIKESFFDTEKIAKLKDRKTRKSLSKAGAFIRRDAQFSMRSRKGVAPPGQPPYAHEKLLKRLLFFSYDETENSVVVGPVKTAEHQDKDIPRLLEEGGVTQKEKKSGERVTLSYHEHPYMKPAFDKNIGKVADMFRSS